MKFSSLCNCLFPIWRAATECFTPEKKNTKSASRNLLRTKQMHETLIDIFKQENLYLTPSSILEIIKTL